MANYYSDNYFQEKCPTFERVTLLNQAETIEGGDVVWDAATALTAPRTYTVRNYDESRHACYKNKRFKPHVIIKCSVDCSVQNLTIANADGVALHVFAANYAATPAYVVLRLDGAGAWELA